MDKYIMFMDQKNQYSENEYITQSNLQIQCNLYQAAAAAAAAAAKSLQSCLTLCDPQMAAHSSTLAWKIPWTEEPGRLQSMGSLRVGHN